MESTGAFTTVEKPRLTSKPVLCRLTCRLATPTKYEGSKDAMKAAAERSMREVMGYTESSDFIRESRSCVFWR